jgi:hypothetical protein
MQAAWIPVDRHGVERRDRRADAAEQHNVAAVVALDQPPDERGAQGDKLVAQIGPLALRSTWLTVYPVQRPIDKQRGPIWPALRHAKTAAASTTSASSRSSC